MRKLLDRLFPERLRRRKELTGPERLQLWHHVTDNDLCLRATQDLLDDLLVHNALIAFSPDTPPDQVEKARLRAGIALELMRQIEDERSQAKVQT